MEADKPSVSHTPFRHRSSLFYSWTSAAALLDSKAGSNARRVDVFDWRKKRFRGRNAEREDGGSGMNPSDRFVKWKVTATIKLRDGLAIVEGPPLRERPQRSRSPFRRTVNGWRPRRDSTGHGLAKSRVGVAPKARSPVGRSSVPARLGDSGSSL